ncbi:MAG: aminoacyl-tRNA hydrolase [Bdellovibrionales bacterium]|nr:aminoacyl-tRNA hydrolase [Bdellovibrionales bacterium]
MIKLLVGLGNPGKKYERTLHNVGFLILDAFASEKQGSAFQKKHQGLYSEVIVEGEKVLFVKPQSYMNLSGEVVGPFMRWHKIDPEEILVIHDEVDLEFGDLRIKKGGGAGGHNGLKSIIAHCGAGFWRLRVGVDKHPGSDLSHYLLSPLSQATLQPLIEEGVEALKQYFSLGPIKAQNLLNQKNKA